MKLKPMKLSVKKQQLLLLAAGAFVLFSKKFTLPGSQNFINDILFDFGLDKTVTTATAYLVIALGGLLLITFFFERK